MPLHKSAYFKGKYLGKLARWYYGYGSEHITSANGSKVAGSYGAEPLMDLDNYENKPINIDLYVEKSYELLKRIGYGKN